uniref:Uncharacterized protein n=1 Tax=Thermogemmatispora argillosa TaxID=2045280 RepID=A0A455T2C3_9CHLR|nr:hypothetical protein KTA_21890 [Thermogemmatispora argillosa]
MNGFPSSLSELNHQADSEEEAEPGLEEERGQSLTSRQLLIAACIAHRLDEETGVDIARSGRQGLGRLLIR